MVPNPINAALNIAHLSFNFLVLYGCELSNFKKLYCNALGAIDIHGPRDTPAQILRVREGGVTRLPDAPADLIRIVHLKGNVR
jgi:hypothetical protein